MDSGIFTLAPFPHFYIVSLIVQPDKVINYILVAIPVRTTGFTTKVPSVISHMTNSESVGVYGTPTLSLAVLKSQPSMAMMIS